MPALVERGELICEGDRTALTTLVDLVEKPRPDFPAVTPAGSQDRLR